MHIKETKTKKVNRKRAHTTNKQKKNKKTNNLHANFFFL